MRFIDEESIEFVVQRFITRTLPKVEWTHAAHLVVGLWHVLHDQDNATALPG